MWRTSPNGSFCIMLLSRLKHLETVFVQKYLGYYAMSQYLQRWGTSLKSDIPVSFILWMFITFNGRQDSSRVYWEDVSICQTEILSILQALSQVKKLSQKWEMGWKAVTQSVLTCSKLTIEAKCEIYSKLTIKTPEQRQWRRSGIFVVLTLNITFRQKN